MAEHCLKQRAARSPVAIGEWMDGLELGMRERGMRENRQIVSLDELQEISNRVGDTIAMRRNEKREVCPRLPPPIQTCSGRQRPALTIARADAVRFSMRELAAASLHRRTAEQWAISPPMRSSKRASSADASPTLAASSPGRLRVTSTILGGIAAWYGP